MDVETQGQSGWTKVASLPDPGPGTAGMYSQAPGQPQSSPTPGSPVPGKSSLPFGASPGTYSLMEYARMLGTPVGVPAAMIGSLVCGGQDTCTKGIVLGIAFGVGYYGWTRRDILGYALMATSGAAAIVTLFDSPRILPL